MLLVRTGPFRYFRHPNYLLVIAEIAMLPLAFGAIAIATVFSALNLVRSPGASRIEESVLAPRRGGERRRMTAAYLAAGSGSRPGSGFVAMAVGMFLAILDTQIVASSLPEIQDRVGIPSAN